MVPMTIRFSNQIVAELIQPFWAAWQGGEFTTDASAIAGTHVSVVWRGCVRPVACVRAAGAACMGVTCLGVKDPDRLAPEAWLEYRSA